MAANIKFEELTPAQKRVVIAKDVIKWIKANKIWVTTGTYFDVDDLNKEKRVKGKDEWGYDDYRYELLFNDKDELNKVIKKNDMECTACAKGCVLYSHVMRNNNFSVGEAKNVGPDDINKKLRGIFTKSQLDLIETAFEGDRYYGENSSIDKYAKKFYAEYDEDSERLVAIMKNIIKNKGEFKPQKEEFELEESDNYDDYDSYGNSAYPY